jgi:hypothetical protein
VTVQPGWPSSLSSGSVSGCRRPARRRVRASVGRAGHSTEIRVLSGPGPGICARVRTRPRTRKKLQERPQVPGIGSGSGWDPVASLCRSRRGKVCGWARAATPPRLKATREHQGIQFLQALVAEIWVHVGGVSGPAALWLAALPQVFLIIQQAPGFILIL